MKAVAVGFLSILVGGFVIDLFGYKYVNIDWPGGALKKIVGRTPMYWVGSVIIGLGIAAFIGGIVVFLLSRSE